MYTFLEAIKGCTPMNENVKQKKWRFGIQDRGYDRDRDREKEEEGENAQNEDEGRSWDKC